MQILALETTEAIGNLAAFSCGKMLLQMDLEPILRSAQSLAPGVKLLLEQVGWRPSDVQLVAVTTGPGSFTGLRVGVAFAKTFAYVVGAGVLGIDTLEAIVHGLPSDLPSVACAMDAQRGEVVANTFHRTGAGDFLSIGPNQRIDADAWLQSLPRGMAVTGPVLGKLANQLPEGIVAVDQRYWRPRASAVAQLAYRDYLAGRRQDLWNLLPVYSRRSAAEEKQVAAASARQEG